jgi:L-alanine-DL-glutamate epimerase-like enolase superfamily enzyme
VIGRGLVATGGHAGQYVYVRVETEGGAVGWGETVALPTWSYETVESITSTVLQTPGADHFWVVLCSTRLISSAGSTKR